MEYCGEWYDVATDGALTVGRDADVVIDDNPALDAAALRVAHDGELWWLESLSESLKVQVSDPGGRVSAELGPGARVPVVLAPLHVVFSAGPTTYEFSVHGDLPFRASATSAELAPSRVVAPRLTPAQRLLLVVLCEPTLRGGTAGRYPTSAEAAARLGWSLTAYNRKLDNVCDRLDRAGVTGLRGSRGRLATDRRARLIDYAIQSRLVTVDDLALLPGA